MLTYALLVAPAFADPAVVFESGPARPVALSEDGAVLYIANLPDGRLDRLDSATGALTGSVAVGMDPVAVAVRGDRAWVVEQLSDSVSVVDLSGPDLRVISTLRVGDEPSDVVFAGDRAFITASHRGRALPTDPQSELPGVGRADVWVYDTTATPPRLEAVLQLFGDSPRALAVSPDERTVYASVFRSGNQTAVVPHHIVCDGGEAAPPCAVDGYQLPGGLPGPNADSEGVPQPEVGLIVRREGAAWLDELGRDWREGIRFDLPDCDVFAIDALTLQEVERWSGVGTVLYAMAVASDGQLLVANTEAHNEVRFAGLAASGGSTVRGKLHLAQLTLVDPQSQPAPIHLNPHIDYRTVPSPPGVEDASIAQPVALDIGPEGQVWIAGYGSAAILVTDLAALRSTVDWPTPDRLVATAPGPAGLRIDGDARAVYVYSRFENTVQAFDLDTREPLWRQALHSPEPSGVAIGRALFHDARLNSSNGEASCGVCHVFGHDDGIAWDLGDPDGVTLPNPNPIREGDPGPAFDLHPLKGPMRTQTLRGIRDAGPMHWRGDRADLSAFAEAFEGLLGESAPADPLVMDGIADWALEIYPPPNPHMAIDGARTAAQDAAWAEIAAGDCLECHILDPDQGHWGTDGLVAANASPPQFMKIPSLRQAYTKVGLFWTGSDPRIPGPGDPLGPQVTAYGWFHDGAMGSVPEGTLEAVLAFPTNFAPAVGEHLTLRAPNDPERTRLTVLLERAAAGDCELVGHVGARGWLWDGAAWQSDSGQAPLTTDEWVAMAPVSVLCAPVGLGARLALDRDWDGLINGEDNCEAVENPSQSDEDADGYGDPCDPGDPAVEDTGSPAPVPPALPRARSRCGCDASSETPGLPVWILLGVFALRRQTGRAASFLE